MQTSRRSHERQATASHEHGDPGGSDGSRVTSRRSPGRERGQRRRPPRGTTERPLRGQRPSRASWTVPGMEVHERRQQASQRGPRQTQRWTARATVTAVSPPPSATQARQVAPTRQQEAPTTPTDQTIAHCTRRDRDQPSAPRTRRHARAAECETAAPPRAAGRARPAAPGAAHGAPATARTARDQRHAGPEEHPPPVLLGEHAARERAERERDAGGRCRAIRGRKPAGASSGGAGALDRVAGHEHGGGVGAAQTSRPTAMATRRRPRSGAQARDSRASRTAPRAPAGRRSAPTARRGRRAQVQPDVAAAARRPPCVAAGPTASGSERRRASRRDLDLALERLRQQVGVAAGGPDRHASRRAPGRRRPRA